MAVFTPIDEKDLAGFLSDYALGPVRRFAAIPEGTENTNYALETEAGRFILTLIERRTPADDLPFVLGLMRHLAESGAPVSEPVADRSGIVLKPLKGRPAIVLRWLEGRSAEDPGVAQCALAGAALARLHLAARSYGVERPNPYGPDRWPQLLAESEALAATGTGGAESRDGATVEHLAALLARCRECADALAAEWPANDRRLPRGAIHADLFPDNLFFAEDRVSGIFDFYFASTDLLAYDLAVAAAAWCFDRANRFHLDRWRALTAAYAAERPLDDAEWRALPLLCTGAGLRFTLTRLVDRLRPLDRALVVLKDPWEFAHRMAFFATHGDELREGS
ncbi:MAG: homoserine kinase [Alphaproteobacteria bacterium]|nr:MAG: homoserine kinase [Alphaproteobacteria bacterium]